MLQYVLPIDVYNAVESCKCVTTGDILSDLFHVIAPSSHGYMKEKQALVDNGIQVTTNNHKFLLQNYSEITFNKFICDAGKKVAYKVDGQGYLYVPRGNGSYIYIP